MPTAFPTATAATLSLKANAPDALIVGEAPRTITVQVQAGEGDTGAVQLHQKFTDRYGAETAGETIVIDLAKPFSTQVEVPVEYFGPTTYTARLMKGDSLLQEEEQMLIRPLPVPRLSLEERAKSPIGTNTHHGAHWETLGAMGIHWARDYSWGWLGEVERLPIASNGLDFSGKFEEADRAGITILPILQQAFRTPDKKFFIDDMPRISNAYQALSNRWPQIPFWELDNEADLVHRDRESEDFKKWYQTYLKYILAADEGLAHAGRGAKVVLNGEAGIHIDEAADMIKKVGDRFSVLNYHFYTGTVAPENAVNDTNTGQESKISKISFLDRVRQINRLAHAAGKEAWLTEIAWAARRGPAVGDRLQSAYLHRIYLLGAWAGTDKTFWFWDRDMPGEGRFSSTGLIHQKEENENRAPKGALPAGAAMAAVSKFIARARYAGSVDLGTGRWCLAFKRPEGGFTVAAWAVGREFPLPVELAAAGESFDMYGNPLRDRQLSDEPAYFTLESLPASWEPQLKVEWTSPRFVNVRSGDQTEMTMDLPAGASVSWEGLPEGARPGDWDNGHATLTAAPGLGAGEYKITAKSSGPGWQKSFPLILRVTTALDVAADSFTPGKPVEVLVTNRISRELSIGIASKDGKLEPAKITLAPGAAGKVQFVASANTLDPAELSFALSDGGDSTFRVRPRFLNVPRVGEIQVDGDLADWPSGGDITPHHLLVIGAEDSFAPNMKIAWSAEGLYVASRIPVGPGFAGARDPKSFWEWTGIELNLNAADENIDRSQDSNRHLLWFTPIQAPLGDWKLYAGEWLKATEGGKKETLNDDQRPMTACRYDGEVLTLEVFVPVEILKAPPAPGQVWPISINAKIGSALSPRTVATWAAGTGAGSNGWGRLRFRE